ncbi:LysE family translocator [Nitratireductor sp.]|uniref:LysE family translocator n=1 Tax=Nitratireductor sp. TaxID=1872084 RepID=UPI0025F052C7|nr:LysE family translocator [Nitratireductor sp.]
MSWEFLVTALVVVLIPGTGVVYTLAVAIGQGLRPSFVAALGCTLGIVPHMVASILGLAALLHASAVAFQVVKAAGVAYLIWMAWNVWRGRGALTIEGRNTKAPVRMLIQDGVLLNVLNPKLSVFFLAFLPQFVPVGASDATRQMFFLALVFMAMTFAAFALYGAFASALRKHVLSKPRAMAWLRGTFAASFALLGFKLAFTGR